MQIYPQSVVHIPAQGPLMFPGLTWTYLQKVLATSPLEVWTLGEASGTTALAQVSAARNGAYSNVTLGQTGIGDGGTSALFVPASAPRCNIYSASLAAALNAAEGGMMIWAAVSSWTDGLAHYIAILAADGNNEISLFKSATNNRVDAYYDAGSTVKRVSITGLSSTGFLNFGMSWSKSSGASGELKGYLGGAQFGTTQTNLGAWSGTLAPTLANIGSYNATLLRFSGTLAFMAIWTAPPTAATFASLATVP